MDTPVTTPVAADLVALANRQNVAMNTIRKSGGGYQAFITAVHIVGPFGGDTAIQLQLGGDIVRKQYTDFVDEVADWEGIAVMMGNLTDPQKRALALANLAILSTQNITILVY